MLPAASTVLMLISSQLGAEGGKPNQFGLTPISKKPGSVPFRMYSKAYTIGARQANNAHVELVCNKTGSCLYRIYSKGCTNCARRPCNAL